MNWKCIADALIVGALALLAKFIRVFFLPVDDAAFGTAILLLAPAVEKMMAILASVYTAHIEIVEQLFEQAWRSSPTFSVNTPFGKRSTQGVVTRVPRCFDDTMPSGKTIEHHFGPA